MKIIPVIHILDQDQVKTNIETCLSLGIDQVFLINMVRSWDAVSKLSGICKAMQDEYPRLWIGLNYLQLNNSDALEACAEMKANGLWADNAGLLRPGDEVSVSRFHALLQQSEGSAQTGRVQFFGGVEFKYQQQPAASDLAWLYENAVQYIDVVTTSGPGTGRAIDYSKLERIRRFMPAHPLAVASGVSTDNARGIAEYADYALVASSITQPFTELIQGEKLQELLDVL
jgi:predicted TIM-barrel enzyme